MVWTKEERAVYMKKYKKDNKEKIKEKQKKYDQTYQNIPEIKKSRIIYNWKYKGLIHDNYSELYDKYIETTCCEVCKYVFDKSNFRCMDHCHDTGLFRQILCNSCNTRDSWKSKLG